MKILFVAAEATPLAKVGGLGEVVGSLPKSLHQLGHDVRLVIPRYGIMDTERYPMTSVIDNISVRTMKVTKSVALRVTEIAENIKTYLVDSDDFANSCEVYGKNDLQRFLLFCRAVVEVLPELNWQPEIVHCHDWHTALIPWWLKKDDNEYALVLTIHNLAYQGAFDDSFLSASGLEECWRARSLGVPEPALNFMAQGILWADMVTTVSETYAKEIMTPEYGNGLDQILRYRGDKILGIVNGIDYDEYDPATDPLIPANYDSSTLGRRTTNKMILQEKAKLPQNAQTPVIGMVSRLDEQKGMDILFEGLDSLLEDIDVQLVILGIGRELYHDLLIKAADEHPKQVATFLTFDDALSHLIYAGCDMFLMPSRFEPCGLGQLVAMRYGAVPVVRRTGGLADTVQDLTRDFNEGTGFVFQDYEPRAMLATIRRALEAYHEHKGAWHEVMRRIMALDFSWRSSAKKYESVYYEALRLKNYGTK
jgi:starch synthase